MDISAVDIENGQLSLTPAIALFQTARAVSPRSWGEVEPKDERALTALATGVFALQAAADDAQRYVVIAARKAGASWEDLAAATGSWSGEELRDWYVKTQHANYDWPLELHAEICRLLEPDPTDDEEQ